MKLGHTRTLLEDPPLAINELRESETAQSNS